MLMVFSMAACGSSDDGGSSADGALSVEEIGTVYVGIDGAYPPYCFLNGDDAVDGFEVAVMNEIAARTGLTIECQITAWTSMFGQLDSGRIDTVAECITVTDERSATYTPSKSYIEDSNRADSIRELFNTALEEMKADGTLGKLSEEWLGADISIVE